MMSSWSQPTQRAHPGPAHHPRNAQSPRKTLTRNWRMPRREDRWKLELSVPVVAELSSVLLPVMLCSKISVNHNGYSYMVYLDVRSGLDQCTSLCYVLPSCVVHSSQWSTCGGLWNGLYFAWDGELSLRQGLFTWVTAGKILIQNLERLQACAMGHLGVVQPWHYGNQIDLGLQTVIACTGVSVLPPCGMQTKQFVDNKKSRKPWTKLSLFSVYYYSCVPLLHNHAFCQAVMVTQEDGLSSGGYLY